MQIFYRSNRAYLRCFRVDVDRWRKLEPVSAIALVLDRKDVAILTSRELFREGFLVFYNEYIHLLKRLILRTMEKNRVK